MVEGKYLLASGVTKAYGGSRGLGPVPVLRGVSLTVGPGEFTAIVGPSGSGKSTLLHCLSGLEPYDGGSVSILGRELSSLSRQQLAVLRQQNIGFIFQAYNLIASLSARENVALPLRLSRRFDGGRVDAALAEVGLSDRAGHLPGQLSGGQQQRVAIARVLAAQPRMVFADEPTGALDSRRSREVMTLLRRIASGERSVVMVTHDVEYAAEADRVLVLRDGLVHTELFSPAPHQVLAALEEAASASSLDSGEEASDAAPGLR